MKPLQLPPTLRAANQEELTNTSGHLQRIWHLETARVIPGYTFRRNTSADAPYFFYAEINVHNSQLWNLFIRLAEQLPSEISLMYHHAQEKEMYSPYMDKSSLLQQLQDYSDELTQDCFLCAGVLHYSDDWLEEVYITSSKYLKYWGMEEGAFRTMMRHFELEEIPGLQFIDEFPRVTEPLQKYLPDCLDSWEVLGMMLKRFGMEKK